MSIRFMTLIWPSQMPPAQKQVLLALGDMSDDKGGCCADTTCIAQRAAVSVEQTTQAIHALIEERWISATADHLGGASPRRYQINARKFHADALVKAGA